MASDIVLNEMIEHAEYMDTLVQKGKLPESVFPRLCYFGHKVLNTIHKDIQNFKCIKCDIEWAMPDSATNDIHCPQCNDDSDKLVFNITDDKQLCKWQCYDCKFEWTSKYGEICPSCKSCTHYGFWEKDNSASCKCTKCGTLKSDWLSSDNKLGVAKTEYSKYRSF